MNVEHRIRSFVEGQMAQGGGGASVASDDESLVFTGRLSSVDVVEIAAFLEQEFGVDFAARGFDQNDFDSIAKMAALVRECGNGAA
jgi:acyl carrier protein